MIKGCYPEDSPTFLHDRPETLSFDIVFNKKPFHKDYDIPHDKIKNLNHFSDLIKLKAATMSLIDGMRSEIQLSPYHIYANNKEYRDDEYHVSVVFDVSEFSMSATEKLLHAQLHINRDRLVDEDEAQFTLDRLLEMRGLPIYVFEDTDLA